MHNSHHGETKVCRAKLIHRVSTTNEVRRARETDEFRYFREIVVADGGSHEFALFLRLVEGVSGGRDRMTVAGIP